jgi:soluble P-type ATPase
VGPHTIADGDDKARFVEGLGAERCVAIGNGANDAAMLAAAALGIAVVGPEGAAGSALLAADVVARSIADALDLVLDERALVATLRC